MNLPFFRHPRNPRAPAEPRIGACWLVFAAAVVALLSVLAVTWTLDSIELQLKEQIAESLRTVVATARAGITLWRDDIEAELSVLAQSPELASAVQRQLELARAGWSDPEPVGELAAVLRPILDLYDYTGFSVIAPGGAEIASSGDGALDAAFPGRPDESVVGAAFAGNIAVRLSADPAENVRTSLRAAVPVRDRTQAIAAVLVLYLDPTKGLTDMTRLGRPGATGETYVYDRNGRLLTASRFPEPAQAGGTAENTGSAPRKSPSPRIAADAQLDAASPASADRPISIDIEGYSDYRGVQVVGAWTWVKEPGVGIATEVDRDEAMSSYRTIRTVTLLMLAAIGISFAALLAMLFNRGRVLASNYAFREAASARKEALAMVSHDLRSPLGSVLLCSKMLSACTDEQSRNRIASIIQRSGARMESLISDILDVSELEDGRLRIAPRPCDVRAIFDDVKATFAEQAKSRAIELEIDDSRAIPRVLADHGRVVQVLSNLVGNALKFTPNGGRVWLRTAAAAEVRFEVHDSGPGIPAEDVPHVFEQFWKAGSSERVGRGLGLYIAKMLVEQHGGRIWVETSAQHGTAFFFTLPRDTQYPLSQAPVH